MHVKISEWAKRNGVTYRTALRWYHQGILPARAQQLETGTILFHEDTTQYSTPREVTIYARASSHDQRGDIARQVERLKDFAAANGLRVRAVVQEIAFGLNGPRAKLIRLLSDPNVGAILVEHRDRLARLGVEYIEAVLLS